MYGILSDEISPNAQKNKNIAYLSLVHPIIEYSSAVWDLHTATDVLSLEKIQRRATQWVMFDYG